MSKPRKVADTLQYRMDFIGLDANAKAALQKLQPLLRDNVGPALDEFYRRIGGEPETRRFFSDDAHVAGAKSAQERHWDIVAAANYTEDYMDAVRRVGRTHARIGLEPRWYIGGYAIVIERLIHAIIKDQWPSLMRMAAGRSEAMAESVASLVKAALLDVDIAISVYLEALQELREKAEEEARQAIANERRFVADSIGAALSKVAAKDLSQRIAVEMPESYVRIQKDFNEAIAQLGGALESVTDASRSIHTGAQEISTASDNLSQRTEQQAATLEQTAAALDEITATVRKSAEGANHARQIVASANEDSRSSSGVVEMAVEAMDAIAKSSEQIGQIIGVIDEIAFQTNLLALNAGVEAARAGEAGRGFAVVASEVRALAQRSAEAAKEIKTLITASSAQVEQGVKLVAETGKSLQRIKSQVGEINDVVSQIATGAQEQATALQEVNVAVNAMDQNTQQNAAIAEQATAASRSLSQEAVRLTEMVNQFQLVRRSEYASSRRALKAAAPRPTGALPPAPESRPPRSAPKAVVNGADDWSEF